MWGDRPVGGNDRGHRAFTLSKIAFQLTRSTDASSSACWYQASGERLREKRSRQSRICSFVNSPFSLFSLFSRWRFSSTTSMIVFVSGFCGGKVVMVGVSLFNRSIVPVVGTIGGSSCRCRLSAGRPLLSKTRPARWLPFDRSFS